jgi:hypothetical protein
LTVLKPFVDRGQRFRRSARSKFRNDLRNSPTV